jgi:hypothetical protein
MSDLLDAVGSCWKVNLTRRNFLRLATGSSAATLLAGYAPRGAHAAAGDFDAIETSYGNDLVVGHVDIY